MGPTPTKAEHTIQLSQIPDESKHVIGRGATASGKSPTMVSGGGGEAPPSSKSMRGQAISMADLTNQKAYYESLPDQLKKGIEDHPLVKEHGFAPHALFAGIHMDKGRFGGDFAQSYANFMSKGMPGAPISGLPSSPSIPSATRSQVGTAASGMRQQAATV